MGDFESIGESVAVVVFLVDKFENNHSGEAGVVIAGDCSQRAPEDVLSISIGDKRSDCA